MDSAFPYSQYVTGKNFVGRKKDVALLSNLLSQGEHVVISEPPKTGKSSLVQQTLFSMRMSAKSFTVGQFSVLNIRTLQDFLLRYGSTVLRAVASTPSEYASVVEQYLAGTHFVFDPAAFSDRNEVLSLGWELDKGDIQALLRFPFTLAQDRNMRLILIVEEFQFVLFQEDPDLLLRALDAQMRMAQESGQRQFSLIITGSGINAMQSIFQGSRLFHRLVERVELSPVDEREMADHVHKGFLSGGKVVDKDLLMGACRLFRGNLWYINHFAAVCDSMSRGYIMEPVLVDALQCLIAVHEPRFLELMGNLTTFQVNLLRATLDGVNRFSSSEVIRKYGLNSSANVKRLKDALMKKEVLSFDANDNPTIIDPLFEYWLKKYYFEIHE